MYISKIKEDVKNILHSNQRNRTARCISADLKMIKNLAAQIKIKFGDASAQLNKLKPMVGETGPESFRNRTVF
ncbi:Retrovirus-related Pol polyprotein [Aphis craccivora]|uniref:Retrovirus-related Pol polyprotein n=1 Tax=Aphis craccivora TaxID=307492 RepID=A0A6G0Y7C7_APHCR|nr:Retrovirus-related Pol polyprotein [Aphis craccivora]